MAFERTQSQVRSKRGIKERAGVNSTAKCVEVTYTKADLFAKLYIKDRGESWIISILSILDHASRIKLS